MQNKREFMSPKEVAARLGRSVKFVYRILRANTMESYRIGGAWAITEAQYQKYVKSCEVT